MTLSSPLPTNLTVNFRTVASTASSGSDFAAKTGNVTIPAGKTVVNITVVIKSDTTPEADETLSVELTGTNNPVVELGRSTGTILILDDESVPYGTPGHRPSRSAM